jgi:hypothetical protein
MNFLHYDLTLSSDDVVEVTLDKQANVRLLDDTNFSHYKRGGQHTYHGGRASKSPIVLKPPHSGHWNLVVDLGGYAGTVRASIRILKRREHGQQPRCQPTA